MGFSFVPWPRKKRIGIGWQISNITGWGVYGLNLTMELLHDRRYHPCALLEPLIVSADPLSASRLAPLLAESKTLRKENRLSFPLFRGFGNDFVSSTEVTGVTNIGFLFIENTHFTKAGLDRARGMDALVAGSSWNYQLLSQFQLPKTFVNVQGIDLGIFHPAHVWKAFPDRFVIFSGGKLEYRKGQDLVIAAFRRFREKHPDALLVFGWHNLWPSTVREIGTAQLVAGVPQPDAYGRWDFRAWLWQNGLPDDSFIDIGCVPNHLMPQVLRQADVGLFPNRCEGGTNLVAMETLACGVPCILSRNTGHMDIISDDCLVLRQQGRCRPSPAFAGVEGWGESSVDEIVAHLEWAYHNRSQLTEMGAQAAQRMKGFSWKIQIHKLLDHLKL